MGLGAAFDAVALGVAFGAVFGLASGLLKSQLRKLESDSEETAEEYRATRPADTQHASRDVNLHEVRINSNLTLLLVTDLESTPDELANLYAHRVDVEIDIRNGRWFWTLKTSRLAAPTRF